MTPEAARASLRNQIEQHGEPIVVRRYSGTGPGRTSADYETRGRAVGFSPDEVAGNIQIGERKVILMAEDLEATAISLPVVKSDRLVVRGKELGILAVDDNKRRIAEVLIAYEIRVMGPQ